MRSITTGVIDGDTSSVEGVEPGEVIVTDNYNKLGDGMRVNVRPRGGEGRQGAAPGGPKKRKKKDQTQEDPQ
jgi:hypothetical protein